MTVTSLVSGLLNETVCIFLYRLLHILALRGYQAAGSDAGDVRQNYVIYSLGSFHLGEGRHLQGSCTTSVGFKWPGLTCTAGYQAQSRTTALVTRSDKHQLSKSC